tara:strand:+ start:123 stop:395 length:273 start_codon:yes stop_codon:yes gene_type:complete
VISTIFRWFRQDKQAVLSSKEEARRRLKLLLIHDQLELTPSDLDAMKGEILEVVKRYTSVDEDAADVRVTRQSRNLTISSQIPVRRDAQG